MQISSRDEETNSRVPDVSSQTRDDLNVPSCVAVVEDYDCKASKGHDQDNLTGDEQASEDLPEIGSWGQKKDAVDVKLGEALTYEKNRELQLRHPWLFHHLLFHPHPTSTVYHLS